MRHMLCATLFCFGLFSVGVAEAKHFGKKRGTGIRAEVTICPVQPICPVVPALVQTCCPSSIPNLSGQPVIISNQPGQTAEDFLGNLGGPGIRTIIAAEPIQIQP